MQNILRQDMKRLTFGVISISFVLSSAALADVQLNCAIEEQGEFPLTIDLSDGKIFVGQLTLDIVRNTDEVIVAILEAAELGNGPVVLTLKRETGDLAVADFSENVWFKAVRGTCLQPIEW
jgi:hypothetical protein